MINERIIIEEKTKDYDEAWIQTLLLAGICGIVSRTERCL